MSLQSRSRLRPPSNSTLHVEELLRRYPAISASELRDLIAAYRRLPMLDRALMTADDRLSRKLELLHQAHHDELRPSWLTMMGVLSLPAAALGVGGWFLLAEASAM